MCIYNEKTKKIECELRNRHKWLCVLFYFPLFLFIIKKGIPMNKSESKYFNTALKMDKAFLRLLQKKEFAYITVKEICKEAGVNRSTFYLHYENIGDLLAESTAYMYRQFLSYMPEESCMTDVKECPLEELYLITPKYLNPYFTYIKEQKWLFKTVVENSGVLCLDDTYNRMFSHVFTPILERFQVPIKDRKYMMIYYIHGILAITEQWLQNDCEDSVEHIVDILVRLIMGNVSGKQ